VIADNATGKGSAIARGAARQGELILAGLLRCGHCGRKMYVTYGKSGRYYCQGAAVNHGTERCLAGGGRRADQVVATEVLRVLKPLGIDAAARRSKFRPLKRLQLGGSSIWHSPKHAMRLPMRADNTTASILPIGW